MAGAKLRWVWRLSAHSRDESQAWQHLLSSPSALAHLSGVSSWGSHVGQISADSAAFSSPNRSALTMYEVIFRLFIFLSINFIVLFLQTLQQLKKKKEEEEDKGS